LYIFFSILVCFKRIVQSLWFEKVKKLKNEKGKKKWKSEKDKKMEK
jgi:hypothetical protein